MAEQPKYNEKKLFRELLRAGIPVDGVQSSGIVTFNGRATDEDKEKAKEIVKNHNPVENFFSERVKELYFNLKQSKHEDLEELEALLTQVIKILEKEDDE